MISFNSFKYVFLRGLNLLLLCTMKLAALLTEMLMWPCLLAPFEASEKAEVNNNELDYSYILSWERIQN